MRSITIVLRDLVACWLILVEVVFPVETAAWLDCTMKCNSGSECWKQGSFLEDLTTVS